MSCEDGARKASPYINHEMTKKQGVIEVIYSLAYSVDLLRPFNKYESRLCYTENRKILSLKHDPENND